MNDTQVTLVLEHLRKEGSITSLDAFKLYGITRLSAKIYILRDKGYDVRTLYETSENRYGHKTRYGRYILVEDNNAD